jgi:acyl-CoA thioesterase I
MTGDDMDRKTFDGAVAKAYGVVPRASNLAIAIALAATPALAEPRIAALGDSLTQGYGLPEAEGFVPQLEAWLRANGAPEAEVINAGVSGDTTAGGLARVDWALDGDVDAVIVALGGNDLLRGIDPSTTRANLDGILAATEARDLPVLLAGLPAPGNYGPDYKAEFEAIFPDLAAEYGAILYPSFLAGIGERLDTAGPLMQPDGIHPNADGVADIVEDIGPVVLELIETID